MCLQQGPRRQHWAIATLLAQHWWWAQGWWGGGVVGWWGGGVVGWWGGGVGVGGEWVPASSGPSCRASSSAWQQYQQGTDTAGGPPGGAALRPSAWQRPSARVPRGEGEAGVVVIVQPPEHGTPPRTVLVGQETSPALLLKGRQAPGPRHHLGQVQHRGLASHCAQLHRVGSVEARAVLACRKGESSGAVVRVAGQWGCGAVVRWGCGDVGQWGGVQVAASGQQHCCPHHTHLSCTRELREQSTGLAEGRGMRRGATWRHGPSVHSWC